MHENEPTAEQEHELYGITHYLEKFFSGACGSNSAGVFFTNLKTLLFRLIVLLFIYVGLVAAARRLLLK